MPKLIQVRAEVDDEFAIYISALVGLYHSTKDDSLLSRESMLALDRMVYTISLFLWGLYEEPRGFIEASYLEDLPNLWALRHMMHWNTPTWHTVKKHIPNMQEQPAGWINVPDLRQWWIDEVIEYLKRCHGITIQIGDAPQDTA